MEKRHLQMVASFVLAGSLTACGGGNGGSSLPSVANATNTQGSVVTRALTTAVTSTTSAGVSIDAGGAASGNWIADADFKGGAVATVTNAINTSHVSNPAPQAVYQTQRYANSLTYTVPNLTPNSAYSVGLHFVESFFTAAGQRLFNITINGAPVATNFDIFAAAGGSNLATVKTFNVNADASGKVTVLLSATVNNASIAGVQVTAAAGAVPASPTPAPTQAPVHSVALIDAGGSAAGSWGADSGYSGGWAASPVTAAINTSLVSNPAPQAVYQTQRAGAAFTYAIGSLSPNGAYGVRLHFVESFFTSAGQRVFNVAINGKSALSNFDIFKTAGGQNVAVAMPLSATADATGKITIAFAATVNNASLAAIELTSGSVAPPPTQAPSPPPTAAPTSAASPTPAPVSGTQWPNPGWVPYPGSLLTVPVSSNPSFDSNSTSDINAMWSAAQNDAGRIQVYAGPPPPNSDDYSQPLYFGHAGDPVYTVSCYDYGGNCPASGQTVHIPKGAYPAGGTDHHISIRDLVTGRDVMLWEAPVPNGQGGSYSVGWGTQISSTGNGLNAVGGTASGISALWQLRETDLAHNTINHAIIVQINGESSSGYVYPATGWDNGYFHSGAWPEMGAHFWLDVAPPYASTCPQYAVSYLTALHKYGAYFAENGGVSTPMEAIYESDVPYTYNGGASVWGPLMQSMGGSLVGSSNVAMSSCGINLQQHLHVLTPPSS